MNRTRFVCMATAFCLLRLPSSWAADQCSDVLKNGFINRTSLSTATSSMDDYNTWLCSTEFHTHQEAMDAGISLGFEVYGVPLQLGGQFDNSSRDSWKKAHCSSTTDRSQYSSRYDKVIEDISQPVVFAWRDCMLALYSTRIGLSGVALSHGPRTVTLKVRWTPYDQLDTRLPKVTGYSLVGADIATVGNTLFKIGATVPATETNIDFTRKAPDEPVVVTLNTDRGSVPAYVPPQTMSLRVTGDLTPTVEQRDQQQRDYSFYKADPDDDCVKDLSGSENYYPVDGYAFTSYHYEEGTKNGDRTNYSWGSPTDNHVVLNWHVQGDDGFGGFCARHGWLGLNIHVVGERWATKPLTLFHVETDGGPLQESIAVTYPYLQPSVDVRNFKMQFVLSVGKVIGDDVTTVQLTQGASNSGGVKATPDDSGHVVIDATQAFNDWRASLHGSNALNPQKTNLLAAKIDAKAKQTCSAAGSDLVAHNVKKAEASQQFEITCGPNPEQVVATAPKTANKKLTMTIQ